MSQSAPGWYQDHDDPRLARWWDGDRWTEHTLVLDEQDWSTEPDPPQTRFPADTAALAAVEEPAAGYEADIYAPIRDPWGDEEPTTAEPAPTAAWASSDDDTGWAGGAAVAGTGAAWAGGESAGWGDPDYEGPRRGAQAIPPWAKIALPIGVVAMVVLAFVIFSGGGDDPVATDGSSTTTTSAPATLGQAADAALDAAGTGPFTRSTFTTLIPLVCDAAKSGDTDALVGRITALGYDAAATTNLMRGLRAGAVASCPTDFAGAPGLLNTVESAVLAGAGTSSTTSTSIDEDPNATTSTTRRSTTTTRRPDPTTTSTTVADTTTTSTTVADTTTTTSTTVPDPPCDEGDECP